MRVLSSVDHRNHTVAQQIHAIRMAAYRQEAELLGLDRFPPLERGVDDILSSEEEFVGAFEGESLAGVLSVCPDEEGRGVSISSLVVHPTFQGRGLGRALVETVIERHGAGEITVQTAAANTPALTLYSRFGFKEYRRWFLGSEPLELVKLSRPPEPAKSTA
jgi:ribosomal protein S18 acetylase RimI-like enzyme